MALETIAETGERQGVVGRVAHQLGIGAETLRTWVKRAEVDSGRRPGVPTEQQRRLGELEREHRELRRANEDGGFKRSPRLSSRVCQDEVGPPGWFVSSLPGPSAVASPGLAARRAPPDRAG
jgi:transposase